MFLIYSLLHPEISRPMVAVANSSVTHNQDLLAGSAIRRYPPHHVCASKSGADWLLPLYYFFDSFFYYFLLLFSRQSWGGTMVARCRLPSSSPDVSVVIPTLNEARNLPHVFARLPAGLCEVIVVDGRSVDDTPAVARKLRPDARIVMQTRTGKGNALACGLAAARGDIIAMIDADGSTDPTEIPRFVTALLAGADFAKGSRFVAGGGSRDITRIRSLGNHLLCRLVNLLYGTAYTDLCYGFNVFWRKHLPVLRLDAASPLPAGRDGPLWGDGFEVETLINVRIAEAGLVVAEVPSFEHSRIYGVSNLSAFSDGRRVLQTILREWAPGGLRRPSSPVRVEAKQAGPAIGGGAAAGRRAG